MSEYGEIYTYEDAEKAKDYIGKKGMFSNNLRNIKEKPQECISGSLTNVDMGDNSHIYCCDDSSHWQFFRPLLEEETPRLMTKEEIMEWVARGNGLLATDYMKGVEGNNLWWGIRISGSYQEHIKEEVPKCYRIRHFGTDECLVPTRDIFIKDCRGFKEATE